LSQVKITSETEKWQNDPALKELDKKGIPYRVFTHPGKLESLHQAARERGQEPEQVVRSILFRCSGDRYVMVLFAGPEQISWTALRRTLDVSRISMASKDQVIEQTGYPIGAVTPFGLPNPVRILVDENVFQPEEVSLGSGVRYRAVIMRSADLRRALDNYEIVNLS